MNFLSGHLKTDSRTMWRLVNKRKRTSCILLLASILTLWFIFRDDAHVRDLTKKATFYMTNKKTSKTAAIEEPEKSKISMDQLMKETANVVNRRVEHTRKLCHGNFSFYNGYLNPKAFKAHAIYNNKHKFVMCLAEKTGCSFFKRILYFYSGHRNISNPFILTLGAAHAVHQNYTMKLTDEELSEIMAKYYKIIFVRDPFKRLFSGYVDKIFSRYDFWGRYSSFSIEKFRPNATKKQLLCGYDTTFPEFVKFVIDHLKHRQNINGHFLPIYQHCNPCSANFDFIGKLEHFYNDASYLFKKLNLGHQEIVSKAKAVAIDDELVDAATIVFSDLQNANLKANECFDWYNFTKRTWRKLQVKGLISTTIPFPLSTTDMNLMTMPQFVAVLKAANADSQADPEFKKTKKYSYLEAYYSVPKSDLEQLAELLRPESEIWGYPVRPKELFDYKNRIPLMSFRFFNFDDV